MRRIAHVVQASQWALRPVPLLSRSVAARAAPVRGRRDLDVVGPPALLRMGDEQRWRRVATGSSKSQSGSRWSRSSQPRERGPVLHAELVHEV